jgi:hypothetical protein
MRKKKSFREKLAASKDLPRIEEIPPQLAARWGVAGRMVIPAPREVDAMMRRVARGRLITVNQIRAALARKHGVDTACPITTGIFASIAARAAGEDEAEGRRRVTPYWRTLKGGGELNRAGWRSRRGGCAPRGTKSSPAASARSWPSPSAGS